MKNSYDISSLDKLSSVALELLRLSDNRIFALYGNLGVGKTTLVKSICNHLKVIDAVSSPTFSIVNEYVNLDNDKVFHFDCYRLHTIDDAYKMGVDVYFDSGNYCFIEWPDLIHEILPKNHVALKINQTGFTRELLLLNY